MDRIPYTYNMTDNGFCLINDIETEIECTVYAFGGDPIVETETVFIEGEKFSDDVLSSIKETVDLTNHIDPFYRDLSKKIKAAALRDADFIERALEAGDVFWSGAGGNDPEQEWRAA